MHYRCGLKSPPESNCEATRSVVELKTDWPTLLISSTESKLSASLSTAAAWLATCVGEIKGLSIEVGDFPLRGRLSMEGNVMGLVVFLENQVVGWSNFGLVHVVFIDGKVIPSGVLNSDGFFQKDVALEVTFFVLSQIELSTDAECATRCSNDRKDWLA